MNRNGMIKASITLLVFVVSLGITSFIRNYITDNPKVDAGDNVTIDNGYTGSNIVDNDINSDTIACEIATVEEADSIEQPAPSGNVKLSVPQINMSIGKYVVDYRSLTYGFTVTINGFPDKAAAEFILCNLELTDTININQNGKFKGIRPIEGGEYRLLISWTDSLGNPGLGIDSIIGGFKTIEKPLIKKMEAQELENYLNRCDIILTRPNKQIASNLRFVFTNLNGGEKVPETIDEIYNKFKFRKWSSVRIVSVDYDNDNRIVAITITINHNED